MCPIGTRWAYLNKNNIDGEVTSPNKIWHCREVTWQHVHLTCSHELSISANSSVADKMNMVEVFGLKNIN